MSETISMEEQIIQGLQDNIGNRIKFDYVDNYVFEGALYRYGDILANDEEKKFPENVRRYCAHKDLGSDDRILSFYDIDLYQKGNEKNKVNLYFCKIFDNKVKTIPEHIEWKWNVLEDNTDKNN